MKRILLVAAALLILSGCGGEDAMDQAMSLRSRFQNNGGCTFRAYITADYGDKFYEFVMDCRSDSLGDLSFTVVEPESIAGISGKISREGGKLTYDDWALGFETLAQGQISPVSAPWVMLNALRGGYLRACSFEGEYLRLTVNDSYEEDALVLDVWADAEHIPVSAEILYSGRRILSLRVENFAFL